MMDINFEYDEHGKQRQVVGEGLKGIIEDARLEDLSHFESCIERIYQLGGALPNDATEFIKISGCEFLQLPPNPTDHKAILGKCLKAEQGAIVNWDKNLQDDIRQRSCNI